MADNSQSGLFTATHLNRGLFSDYYLDHILTASPEWHDEHLFAQVKPLREELRDLYLTLRPEQLDEAQLEERWVKPVLAKLGHFWSVQVKIRYRERGHRKPDYCFAATPEDANAFTNRIYEAAELAHALAVGDAKRWGVHLDQATGPDRNPSQQIDEYLRYSELPWGILTDGRIWRLYQRESSKNNVFYAVDLPALLTSQADEAVENFYYFYLFFRREAFIREGWLDGVLQGSVDYAESLSDQLEDEVYEALHLIAEGFLRYRRNRLNADALTLRTIYEQSLVLLYRLLFILYAESRDVLPMSQNEVYARYRSLRALNWDVKDLLEGDKAVFRRVDEGEIYARLSALFFAIDSGSPEYDVTPYNGRLFSEEEYPFLAEKVVGDAYLAPALDKLARVEAKVRREGQPRRVFVDYRDLDVRHLGAIYEKLLEYQLEVASQSLTVKGNKYQPAAAGDEVDVQPGQVYLRTGNNERKISGSYYTPDYIVRFIVERTLEPLLTDLTQQYADLDAEGHWTPRVHNALRDAILSINVLDPATGSGHFMVEAVAYIADWLRRLGLRPDDLSADEDELVYWKRQVVISCIYGVDVNPLAVELAKLSLWLATIARGRPLSFLDHHVKLGNTLVGARTADIGLDLELSNGEDGQLRLFHDTAFVETLGDAVSRMNTIEHTVADSVQEVKGQEQAYAQLKKATSSLRLLADLWTARHFGLAITQDDWQTLFQGLVKAQGSFDNPLGMSAMQHIEQAGLLADQYHFFHWDLEFPEVFFTPQGQPLPNGGFDAVIGNPPYVRQERIQPYKPYFATYYETHQGTADLFLYFFERALKLVKPSKRVGYITSGTYMNSNSAVEFRRFIHATASFETVVDFGAVQPFKGVDLATNAMIAVLRKGKHGETFRSLFIEGRQPPVSLSEALNKLGFDTPSDMIANPEWRFQSVEVIQLFGKIVATNPQLKRVIGKIYSGIKTGLNEAFVIDGPTRRRLIEEHSSSAEIIKPMRRGQDLRPWYQVDSDQHLILAKQGIDIDKYPAIEQYLAQFQNALAKRSEVVDEQCEWYELRPCDYYDQFEEAKILWADICRFPRFSRNEGYYLGNTAFMIPTGNLSLLALLQSRVTWFAVSQIATPLNIRLGLWRYRVLPQFVERLPIPDLSAAQESGLAELAEQITELARARYRLHEAMRVRVREDLGDGGKLNNALEDWWELDFAAFRDEVRKAFRSDIALKERDEWAAYLADQRTKHEAATAQIVALETRLNGVVYGAFKLTPEEIALIETSTKYPYGAV